MRILLVDNSESTRRHIKGLLEENIHDIEFQEAEDVSKALELIRVCVFNIVIADYIISEMNGVNLIAAVLNECPVNVRHWILMSKVADSLENCLAARKGRISLIDKRFLEEELFLLVMGSY